MIDGVTKERWIGKIRDWFSILNATPITKDDTIWHYTRGESLLAMADNGSLLMTQVSCLNDSTEIRYAISLYREALLEEMSSVKEDEESYAFLKRCIESMNDDADVPANANNAFFVTCFTELRDDLAMWRSYAGGENGYCIGFQVEHLFAGEQGCFIARVNYDPATHKLISQQVAQATVQEYRLWRAAIGQNYSAELEAAFMKEWSDHIEYLAPFVKTEGFHGEKEVRISRPFGEGDSACMQIMQKRTMMTRHLPLRFAAGKIADSDRYLLPIKEILVGPGRHKHVSLVSVHSLLARYGYPGNLGKKSACPFQET